MQLPHNKQIFLIIFLATWESFLEEIRFYSIQKVQERDRRILEKYLFEWNGMEWYM